MHVFIIIAVSACCVLVSVEGMYKDPEKGTEVTAGLPGDSAGAEAASSKMPVPDDLLISLATDDTVTVPFLPGRIGIEWDKKKITTVDPGTQAHRTGVQVGWTIKSIGGKTVSQDPVKADNEIERWIPDERTQNITVTFIMQEPAIPASIRAQVVAMCKERGLAKRLQDATRGSAIPLENVESDTPNGPKDTIIDIKPIKDLVISDCESETEEAKRFCLDENSFDKLKGYFKEFCCREVDKGYLKDCGHCETVMALCGLGCDKIPSGCKDIWSCSNCKACFSKEEWFTKLLKRCEGCTKCADGVWACVQSLGHCLFCTLIESPPLCCCNKHSFCFNFAGDCWNWCCCKD